MTGVSFTVDLDPASLARAENVLARLADDDLSALVEGIKGLIENQTKQRMATEKASPEGDPWTAWGAHYAKTRHGGHKLLEGEGDLLKSMQYFASGNEVIVGSNLEYAAMHQFGGSKEAFPHLWGDIPARPYLGLSADNRAEIEDLVVDMLGGVLA